MTTIAQLVENAYLAGYRYGLTAFAFWKDGQQFVGNSSCVRLSEALKHAPEDCKEEYGMFLRAQQVRHDGDERPIVLEESDGHG